MTDDGWTLATLKKHFDDLRNADKEAITTALSAAEKAVAAAMAASEKAILKAETAADKRAEASNEIRAAMVDQQKFFSNKDQTDLQFSNIVHRVESLEQEIAAGKNRAAGIVQLWGMIGAVIGAVVLILGIIFVVVRGATPA